MTGTLPYLEAFVILALPVYIYGNRRLNGE